MSNPNDDARKAAAEKMNELYQSVTDRIVALIEGGTKPWEMPWAPSQGKGLCLLPANLITARRYSGINTLILWIEAIEKGYPTHGWLTFRQANEKGAKVRKGEKATTVVYVNRREVEEDDGKGGKQKKMVGFLKSYSVFNLAQVTGLPDEYTGTAVPFDEDDSLDRVKAIIKGSNIPVFWGADKAFYNRKTDQIAMPSRASFRDDDACFATLFHEMSHATGNDKRLNRTFGKRFGDKEYAAEEVVAELSSAFLCAALGFQHEHESAAYIGHWVEVMKADNRAIFHAASHASHAADWLLECEHADTDKVAAE